MNSWRARRWNGWGFTDVVYPLSRTLRSHLKKELGKGVPLAEAKLGEVLEKVPPSRLPFHELVSVDPETRVRYAVGQSIPDWIAMRSGHFAAFPDGVAFPETNEDVQELLQWAEMYQVSVIPYGGGTSVVGHVTVLEQEKAVLTISLEKMCHLVAIDTLSQLARFQAGITGADLEAKLNAQGYTLGHFPQSFELSTLGGWIATRSKGQLSLRYGGIDEMFMGGRLETFQGSLEMPVFPHSAAGPDLKEMVLGSEGRLGIITEAVVKIKPLSPIEIWGCFFPSWEKGVEAVRKLVQSGKSLSMLRLSNPKETEAQLVMSGHPWKVKALEIYLRFRGVAEGKCLLLVGNPPKKDFLGKFLGEKWKKARFLVPYLRESLWREGYIVDTLETACTWDKVDRMVRGIEKALEGSYAFTHLSHLYPQGSSIYTTFVFRQKESYAETLGEWKRLKTAASTAIVSIGGTISHQHGVGLDHKPYLSAEKGEIGLEAIRALCDSLDPNHLLNPHKLV